MSGNSLNRSLGDLVGSGKPKEPLGLTPREENGCGATSLPVLLSRRRGGSLRTSLESKQVGFDSPLFHHYRLSLSRRRGSRVRFPSLGLHLSRSPQCRRVASQVVVVLPIRTSPESSSTPSCHGPGLSLSLSLSLSLYTISCFYPPIVDLVVDVSIAVAKLEELD
ncbi:hypothetical protein CRG98_006361 [Punica granatum]|uniref:Uncharacterized protein n=1 Tax=Punica granatum TaxID=22663 RepID=A0A2I0KZC9_PUNGR|nr:hypothetical protein CRG98_006361 [Punica granatum]